MEDNCTLCISEPNQNTLHLQCCSQQACHDCLEKWFLRNRSCPFCRSLFYRVYFAGKAQQPFRQKEDIIHYFNNDNVISSECYNYDKGWNVLDDILYHEGSIIKGSYIYIGPFMYKKILSDTIENDEYDELDYNVVHGNPSEEFVEHIYSGCGGNTRHGIVEVCNEQIQVCDVFIIYLDSEISCYGSMLEFGRALESNKLCVLILPNFDNKMKKAEFCKEVWFLIYQEIKHLEDQQEKWDIHERHIFKTIPQLANRWKDLKAYKKYLDLLK